MGIAWWSADPASPGPTYWEIWGLDGGHPYIWIAFQAYQIITMYQQDMGKGVAAHPCPLIHHNITDTSLGMV